MNEIVIPEGVERIGSYWFWESIIERVQIPASVKEIGTEAFSNCPDLRSVEFAEGSQLRVMGNFCFAQSGLEEITVPRSVETLCEGVFIDCAQLKSVSF